MRLATRTLIVNRHRKEANNLYQATLITSREQHYGFREWWQINQHVTLKILFTEREFTDEKESSIFIYSPTVNITEQVSETIIKNANKVILTARTSGVHFIDLRREDFDEVIAKI